MGDHAPAARPVHDHPARRGRRLLLPQSRPRRGPVVHHQDHGRARRLAGRDRDRAAGAGRRQDREEAAGAPLSRPHRELFAAGRLLHPRHPERQDAARQGEGPLVPGPQEGRRHQERAAAGNHRSRFQRRVRRRLFGALHAHGRRPEPRRAQEPAPRTSASACCACPTSTRSTSSASGRRKSSSSSATPSSPRSASRRSRSSTAWPGRTPSSPAARSIPRPTASICG